MIGTVRRPPVVLCYHGVNEVADEDDPQRIVTSPRNLERHVGFLLRLGYRFATPKELIIGDTARPPGPATAVLTFDDGFADAKTVVVPLLRRLGVRATFYVNPGLLEAQHEFVAGAAGALLDAAGIRALDEAGMEIGSHTMTHPDLRMLDDDGLAEELEGSRTAIERLLGKPARTLAYPFGLYDRRVAWAAKAAGYALAFAWVPGPWHPLAAPRLPAPPRHGAGRLALKMAGVRRPGRWLVGGGPSRI